MSNTSKLIMVRKAVLVLLCVVLVCVGAACAFSRAFLSTQPLPLPEATSAASVPAEEAVPAPSPTTAAGVEAGGQPRVTPVAQADPAAMLATLRANPVPLRDLGDLTQRIKGSPTAAPDGPTTSTPRTVGSRETFWVSDDEASENFVVTATLRYASEHLYMYVEDGAPGISDAAIRASVETFERNIYPTTRRYFGATWGPGRDGDERITILNLRRLGATGYFSSADEESPAGNAYSNGRHMIYMNLEDVRPGTDVYNSTLAHEFQHALHFYQDRDEDAWVSEGASMLSEKLNGYDVSAALAAFRRRPDTQLTTWSDDPSRSAHYGAALAFMSYFFDRYGEQGLRLLMAEPANGAAGFDRTLERLGVAERFDDVVADWAVANIVNNRSLNGGRYGYRDTNLKLTPSWRVEHLPSGETIHRRQYAAYYLELPATSASATVHITGATQVPLVANTAHSGAFQWWGNRADLMDSKLTRAFDLRGLTTATLTYWTWYDLEDGWDYAYVMASVDGGQTWDLLATQHTTTANPVGNNLGVGYTGISGRGSTPQWILDRADLTPYAGKQVLVRFEYVTDDAVTNAGFCIDDLSIAELGFHDDVEDENGWQAEGFVRSSNLIPQSFMLRLVMPDERTVTTASVDGEGRAHVTIPGGRRAILVIVPVAPVTTERARLEYWVTAGP